MDYPRIKTGSTLHLPVLVEGGYLYLGDGHALQGDGEITGNGIEVSCDISFSVRVNRLGLQWPAGEDNDFLYTVVNSKPLERAAQIATAQMAAWLRQSYGMSHDQVGILLGQLVRYELGNLVSKPTPLPAASQNQGCPISPGKLFPDSPTEPRLHNGQVLTNISVALCLRGAWIFLHDTIVLRDKKSPETTGHAIALPFDRHVANHRLHFH